MINGVTPIEQTDQFELNIDNNIYHLEYDYASLINVTEDIYHIYAGDKLEFNVLSNDYEPALTDLLQLTQVFNVKINGEATTSEFLNFDAKGNITFTDNAPINNLDFYHETIVTFDCEVTKEIGESETSSVTINFNNNYNIIKNYTNDMWPTRGSAGNDYFTVPDKAIHVLGKVGHDIFDLSKYKGDHAENKIHFNAEEGDDLFVIDLLTEHHRDSWFGHSNPFLAAWKASDLDIHGAQGTDTLVFKISDYVKDDVANIDNLKESMVQFVNDIKEDSSAMFRMEKPTDFYQDQMRIDAYSIEEVFIEDINITEMNASGIESVIDSFIDSDSFF